MSRVFMIFGFLGFALIAQVAAHGHLTVPRTRDSRQEQSVQNNPNNFPLGSDFVCRNYPSSPQSEWTVLTAGSVSTIQWGMEAAHPGDCFAYISYDADLPDAQKKWFKIATYVACNLQNLQALPLNIPAYLPACEHCILRWEWYALHVQQVKIIEFYSQCADVKIISNIQSGPLPTPQVTIPGHLPMDAIIYRPGFGAGADDLSKVIGPPIATIGGAAYDCVSTYGNSCNVPSETGNPCILSYQRCIGESTYQGCGIGRTNTEWGPSQSCQTGLVCRSAYDDTRIICDRPSSPAPAPASTSTTGASRPVTSTSTTGVSRPVTSTSTSTTGTPRPVTSTSTSTTGTPRPSSTSTTGTPRPSSTSTSTTGSRPSASASTSGSPAIPSSSTSTTGSRPSASTSTTGSSSAQCVSRDQKCEGESAYRICTPNADGVTNSWSSPQSCQVGLKCHPSVTGMNIYCY